MKKYLSLLLAMLTVLSATACGAGDSVSPHRTEPREGFLRKRNL